MEFLSLSHRRYSSRNVLSSEKRGEKAVFADYVKFKLIFLMSANLRQCHHASRYVLACFLGLLPTWTTKTTVVEPFPIWTVDL